MEPKTTLLVVATSAVIVTAVSVTLLTMGLMFAVGYDIQPLVGPQIDIQPQVTRPPVSEIVYVDKTLSHFFNGTNDIKKISSQEELKDILEISLMVGGDYNHRSFRGAPTMIFEESLMMQDIVISDTSGSGSVRLDSSAMSESGMQINRNTAGTASTSLSKESSGGSNYSTTNVQVKNVDEPDYLKNDSKYVYIVSKNTLSIIDAYPAESAKLILKIALDIESQHIQNMFLNNDRLVIFYNGQSADEVIPKFDFAPQLSYSPVTHALIVDVSDKENPVIVKDYSIDGQFRDARMIGDYAYFVTNTNVDYQQPRLPIILNDSERIMTSVAYYFDNAEQFSNFTTLTAIDIFGDKINSESFLMGNTGTFYVSKDNFYLTYRQNTPFGFYDNSLPDRFFDVIVPLLPNDIRVQILKIQDDSSTNFSAQWAEISELMQRSYNQMDKEDKKKLFVQIRQALTEYDINVQADATKTIIHKILINKDDIQYVANGSVPGRLLNQFSMDESGDRFRVATTNEYYVQHQGQIRSNAVYVLDEQLDLVGELEEIAPDESIYSARFMGDRLYMVTFKQIDPFFVIDLSSDTPKILGELKIPGFSNYLHPYDEDHVIGIGRDTKELENGRVQQHGIKLALFDVKDVSNPIVADDVIIGDRSTGSNALNTHKAFFFDPKSGILSIPINGNADTLNEIHNTSNNSDISGSMIAPNFNRWHGFYVFDLDVADGFVLQGTITHSTDNSHSYGSNNARTFYIEEILYTASGQYLKMNYLNNLEEVNSIKLENTGKLVPYLDKN